MTESYESNNARSARLGCLKVFISIFIGFILGGVGGYFSSYFASQKYALVYPASGWELGVMVFTFLSAVFGMVLALLGAGIATSISKPWWMGAISAGIIVVVGMALYQFLGASDVPYSDHKGNEGRVDLLQCNAYGWATDPDDLERDLEIRILVDENPVPVATTVANLQEQYVRLCTGGTCGFSVNLGGIISVDETHQITVQAYDLETDMWEALVNTPKELSCSGYPDGYHDVGAGNINSINCSVIGWAADPDDLERDLEIRILVDENPVPVATTVANLPREDVRVCTGGTCGFVVYLWGQISAVDTHQIIVQAYDLETGKWVVLRNSPRELACQVNEGD